MKYSDCTWGIAMHFYTVVQMLSSRQTAGKLVAIATVIVPVILLGSIITARQNQQPLWPSLYEVYTVVANIPGARST